MVAPRKHPCAKVAALTDATARTAARPVPIGDRLTVWKKWDGASLRPIWDVTAGVELYDHRGDDGTQWILATLAVDAAARRAPFGSDGHAMCTDADLKAWRIASWEPVSRDAAAARLRAAHAPCRQLHRPPVARVERDMTGGLLGSLENIYKLNAVRWCAAETALVNYVIDSVSGSGRLLLAWLADSLSCHANGVEMYRSVFFFQVASTQP